MDFRLFARVLWRFRLLVLLGFILATALSMLALVQVSPDGLKYRQSELWASTTRLLVTQTGFPEGRLYAQQPDMSANPTVPVADPGRFNNLAILYSELATSDPVRRLMRQDGPITGKVVATPLVAGGEFRTQLPMIDITAISTSPIAAIVLAQRSGKALTSFIQAQQEASHVPVADRAVLQDVVRPTRAVVFQPRSKTMPAVVFLVVMFATVGLAFLLENLRPPVRESEDVPRTPLLDASQRRTA